MKVTVFMIIVGIIFLCIFVGLLTLIVRALLKYIHSKDVRQEKSVVRKSLGEALKVHRTQCKMTQEFVAETIGVSRQAVSKWENGQSVPESEKLIAISNYFDVSLDYLLKDENENESNDNAPETGTIQNTSDRTNWFLGVIICVGGIVCLILWGLLSIFNPTASNQSSESSMIQIDGNGIFLILCIVAIVVGAYLLLKNTTKK